MPRKAPSFGFAGQLGSEGSTTHNRLGRVLTDAGRRAGIVVKRWQSGKVKHASAHDFRRTFANEMREMLIQALRANDDVQERTRHSDAQTLVEHYLDEPTPVLMQKLAYGGFSGGAEGRQRRVTT